jgi:hypothetical protein
VGPLENALRLVGRGFESSRDRANEHLRIAGTAIGMRASAELEAEVLLAASPGTEAVSAAAFQLALADCYRASTVRRLRAARWWGRAMRCAGAAYWMLSRVTFARAVVALGFEAFMRGLRAGCLRARSRRRRGGAEGAVTHV